MGNKIEKAVAQFRAAIKEHLGGESFEFEVSHGSKGEKSAYGRVSYTAKVDVWALPLRSLIVAVLYGIYKKCYDAGNAGVSTKISAEKKAKNAKVITDAWRGKALKALVDAKLNDFATGDIADLERGGAIPLEVAETISFLRRNGVRGFPKGCNTPKALEAWYTGTLKPVTPWATVWKIGEAAAAETRARNLRQKAMPFELKK